MANVTTPAGFTAAITALDPNIVVLNDITMTAPTTISYAVTVSGANENVTIFWQPPTTGTNRNLFTLSGANGRLTVSTITIDGQNLDGSLVQINGGTFTMEDGATLKRVTSTTGRRPVKIADNMSTAGGTFIMNGGLITENNCIESVITLGGAIFMNNNARIGGNFCGGVVVGSTLTTPVLRGSLTMTGNAEISDNTSIQSGAGVMVVRADVIIGENEGDAPKITRNTSPFAAGGLYIDEGSTAVFNYGAEVSDNIATTFAAGIAAQNSEVTIKGNAMIKGNKTDSEIGGIMISGTTVLTIEENATVFSNECEGRGGGLYLQRGATAYIQGDAHMYDNKAVDGAGIYISASTVTIGANDSQPAVYSNVAQRYGGGAFVAADSTLNLTGSAIFYKNAAQTGKGIYKLGDVFVTGSPKILDGIYFDDTSGVNPFSVKAAGVVAVVKIGDEESSISLAPTSFSERAKFTALNADDGTYCDNVPIISSPLSQDAEIHLEMSAHVSPPNVPVVIAEKGASYDLLQENDRAAWRIPIGFPPGHYVILNDNKNWVMIARETYKITYYLLYGSENLNPESYSISDTFPIPLLPPGERPGFEFMGWLDERGRPITEIREGTTGNLTIIASWRQISCLIVYRDLFGADNPNPAAYVEDDLPITLQPPGERAGYEFTGWQDENGNTVTEIPVGMSGDLTYTATWRQLPVTIYSIAYYQLFGVSNPNPATYTANDLPITLQAPGARAGYEFTGWRDATGNIVTTIPAGTTGNLGFTATWRELPVTTYSIVYYQLFGSTNPNPATYTANDLPITLQAPGARAGYEFTGWRDAAGNIVTGIPQGTTGNLTFTATWRQAPVATYNIVYYHLFGASNPNPTTYTAADLPIRLQNPGERTGYEFAGWFDANGNAATTIEEGVTGDLVYIALWIEAPRSCLDYSGNAPCVTGVPEAVCVSPGTVVTIPLTIPEKKGHCFVGWNTDNLGAGANYAPGETITVRYGGVTLYALWMPICECSRDMGNPPYCPKRSECVSRFC